MPQPGARSTMFLYFIHIAGCTFPQSAAFFKKIIFIYLFLAALGLCCCAWAFL